MLRLFIMRHGPAEAGEPPMRDFNRALTESGRTRTEAVARELIRRGEVPDRILSSPLVRAQQTAGIVARALKPSPPNRTRDELAPAATALALVEQLAATPGQGVDRGVLLVGHAPDVSELVEALTGRRAGSFAPAVIVALELSDGRARERFVIRPD